MESNIYEENLNHLKCRPLVHYGIFDISQRGNRAYASNGRMTYNNLGVGRIVDYVPFEKRFSNAKKKYNMGYRSYMENLYKKVYSLNSGVFENSESSISFSHFQHCFGLPEYKYNFGDTAFSTYLEKYLETLKQQDIKKIPYNLEVHTPVKQKLDDIVDLAKQVYNTVLDNNVSDYDSLFQNSTIALNSIRNLITEINKMFEQYSDVEELDMFMLITLNKLEEAYHEILDYRENFIFLENKQNSTITIREGYEFVFTQKVTRILLTNLIENQDSEMIKNTFSIIKDEKQLKNILMPYKNQIANMLSDREFFQLISTYYSEIKTTFFNSIYEKYKDIVKIEEESNEKQLLDNKKFQKEVKNKTIDREDIKQISTLEDLVYFLYDVEENINIDMIFMITKRAQEIGIDSDSQSFEDLMYELNGYKDLFITYQKEKQLISKIYNIAGGGMEFKNSSIYPLFKGANKKIVILEDNPYIVSKVEDNTLDHVFDLKEAIRTKQLSFDILKNKTNKEICNKYEIPFLFKRMLEDEDMVKEFKREYEEGQTTFNWDKIAIKSSVISSIDRKAFCKPIINKAIDKILYDFRINGNQLKYKTHKAKDSKVFKTLAKEMYIVRFPITVDSCHLMYFEKQKDGLLHPQHILSNIPMNLQGILVQLEEEGKDKLMRIPNPGETIVASGNIDRRHFLATSQTIHGNKILKSSASYPAVSMHQQNLEEKQILDYLESLKREQQNVQQEEFYRKAM